ncbi:phosphoesterase, partial [Streptomyces anthocyanicus]
AAGRSLYAFSAEESYEGHVKDEDSVSSVVCLADGGRQKETVAWSRVRYLDYSFLRVDVTPAGRGRLATLEVTGVAETGEEVDRFTVARRVR